MRFTRDPHTLLYLLVSSAMLTVGKDKVRDQHQWCAAARYVITVATQPRLARPCFSSLPSIVKPLILGELAAGEP